jgi:hypothetical protein
MVLGEEAGHEQARRLGLDALFVARVGDGLRATGTGFFEGAQTPRLPNPASPSRPDVGR